MSLYQPGDLIFNEYSKEGRLECDGSAVSDEAYPLLKEILEGKILSPPPTLPITVSESISSGTSRQMLAYSKDGNYIAVVGSSTGSTSLNVIRTSDWTEISVPISINYLYHVEFSPDSKYLVITGGSTSTSTRSARIYRTSDWSLSQTISGGLGTITFSADGLTLISGSSSSSVFSVYTTTEDTDTFTFLTNVSCLAVPLCTALSDDGSLLVVGFLGTPNSPMYQVFEGVDWTEVDQSTLSGTAYHACFKPRSKEFCVAYRTYSGQSGAQFVDQETGSVVFVDVQGVPQTVDYTPNGAYLALGSNGSSTNITYLDSVSHQVVTTINSPNTKSVRFDPTGRYLAALQTVSTPLVVYNTEDVAVPTGYFKLPNIPINPKHPSLPVLIQAEEV